MGTPTPYGGTPLYQIPDEERTQQFDVPKEIEGLPEMKPEDQQYFGKLLKEVTMLMSSVKAVCFISITVSSQIQDVCPALTVMVHLAALLAGSAAQKWVPWIICKGNFNSCLVGPA